MNVATSRNRREREAMFLNKFVSPSPPAGGREEKLRAVGRRHAEQSIEESIFSLAYALFRYSVIIRLLFP